VVKRKKDRMEPEEIQDEINAELEEVPQIQVPSEESEELPTPETGFDRVVDQVLRGEWGKGQDRRLRLSQAGIDHVAVQKEILRRMNTK